MKSILISLIVLLACVGAEKKEAAISYSISLTQVGSELEAPIGIVNARDGSNRLFVIEQDGRIRIIKDGKLLPVPFLDVSASCAKLNSIYSEKGLLGLAFHPQYKSNGKFYIYYTAPPVMKGTDCSSVLAEFTVSANADVANPTGKILMRIDEPESNHNGGELAFGPDGYLYIGVGDGGGAGDKHGTGGNGQDIVSALGKILRVDVNGASGIQSPADNPFVNRDGRDEIFAWGLRNPWRFSFDRKTGNLFCGDVGQNEYEEVDIIERGKNYGWRVMEGNHCFNPEVNCDKKNLALPIAEYDHTVGKCIIGGYVYRGTKFKDMQGKYIFGDWTGKFFMLLQPAGGDAWERRDLSVSPVIGDFYINSFGEDEAGELYVCGQSSIGPHKTGKIYRISFN